jgi:RNA polymerase sigma factor (sigma-70 family)
MDEARQRILAEVLQGCLAGDPQSRNSFCKEMQPLLLGEARRMLYSSRFDAEDAVQDALLKILDSLDRRSEFTGDIVAYAVVTQRNHCRSLLRAERLHRGLELRHLGRTSAEMVHEIDRLIVEESRRDLQMALRRLDPFCLDLLKRLFFFNMSTQDVARHLGYEAVQSVYHHRNRCLRELRKIVKIERLRRSPAEDPED